MWSSSLRESTSRTRRPVASAYGTTVCTQRVLDEVTTRWASHASSIGTNRRAWARPSAERGRSRSSRSHDLRACALPWRSTTRARVGLRNGLAVARVSRSWG